jgi:ADP-heptose:LPS heptosyltransferase
MSIYRKLKNSLVAFFCQFLLLIVKLIPARSGKHHLVIIKTDEIGDYFLFRNYLHYFKTSAKYSGWKITLIANQAWESIFERYDSATVDEIVWINKGRFNKDLRYRFSLLKEVRKMCTAEIINCVYSRSLLMDDGFALIADARRLAMHTNDTANRPFFHKWIDSLYYNSIVHAGDKTVFDAERNRNFMAQVLNLPELQTEVELPRVNPSILPLPSNYVVFFLGAGNPERKWPTASFAVIAGYIAKRSGLSIVLAGGPDEAETAKEFSRLFHGDTIDLTGKTSLPELIEVIASASFLLSVDTGAVHIAAAAQCPVIGLFSGKFYGRFGPYPSEVFDKFFPVYPDFVDKMIKENDRRLYDTSYMKNDTIKLIPPVKLMPLIDMITTSD